MSMVTKADLVATLTQNGLSAATARQILDALSERIAGALAAGDTVILPGVGRLDPIDKPERAGRNPATGEAITIAARRQVKFKPSVELREQLQASSHRQAAE
jgi:DNA-binding protein HU-beta